eukprot:Blabericola_migrator_1__6519@NODE_328_length_9722_cov_325_367582_g265_i0_p2_GENE_NODE_328_length_9722_cov_325_367582_g265_i0NODE_328_length_9722_cov_325_367582_g265_i0_p2_ORF_typecomplete_len667_score99_23PAN_4/PF14295_6/6_3e03PAN_4/PF14295_6/0_047PAN_4/PF14295_6/1_8e04PAN_4/PF14295_6/1_6e05PAN_4/PF14295_6/1_1e02_NODE_328_length_9722_cov_325_367582_g265_i057787778
MDYSTPLPSKSVAFDNLQDDLPSATREFSSKRCSSKVKSHSPYVTPSYTNHHLHPNVPASYVYQPHLYNPAVQELVYTSYIQRHVLQNHDPRHIELTTFRHTGSIHRPSMSGRLSNPKSSFTGGRSTRDRTSGGPRSSYRSSNLTLEEDPSNWTSGISKEEKRKLVWIGVSLFVFILVSSAITGVTLYKVLSSSSQSPSNEYEQYAFNLCGNSVSRASGMTNRECSDLCKRVLLQGLDPMENDEYSTWCFIEPYDHTAYSTGTDIIRGTCFDQWIHGGVMLNLSANQYSCGLAPTLYTTTPSDCQYMCQIHSACIRWIWTIRTDNNDGADDNQCCLLSSAHVFEALDTSFEVSAYAFNGERAAFSIRAQQECSSLGMACQRDPSLCFPCNGKWRCVWRSQQHISGWKYCFAQDMCDLMWGFPSLPPVVQDESICDYAFAKEPPETQLLCANLCRYLIIQGEDPSDNENFSRICVIQKWSYEDGVLVIEPPPKDEASVITTHVFGNIPSLRPNAMMLTSNPIDCQAMCFNVGEADCVRWTWYAGTDTAKFQTCYLHDRQAIEDVLKIRLSLTDYTMEEEDMYTANCDVSIVGGCASGLRQCAACGEYARCVATTTDYIGGWRYVDSTFTLCEIPEFRAETSLPDTWDHVNTSNFYRDEHFPVRTKLE